MPLENIFRLLLEKFILSIKSERLKEAKELDGLCSKAIT